MVQYCAREGADNEDKTKRLSDRDLSEVDADYHDRCHYFTFYFFQFRFSKFYGEGCLIAPNRRLWSRS
jgi:hypothetical protein